MNQTKNIGVIGLGLIGGSMALDFKTHGHSVMGFDQSDIHCKKALDLGLVDSIGTLDEMIDKVDIVVIAIPIHHVVTLLPKVLDQISYRQVVLDVGSTKASICAAVADHEKRSRFVAAHPLAGTEFSGPTAAIKGLFAGKKNIICQEDLCDEDALYAVLGLCNQLGMNTLFMQAEDHDKHMAYVSHLSHVSAFGLSHTVLDLEVDEKQVFNLASTGFASTVRLAKSNPDTWLPIMLDNKENVSAALKEYIDHLQAFQSALDQEDANAIIAHMQRANDIKRVLTGIQLNAVKLS